MLRSDGNVGYSNAALVMRGETVKAQMENTLARHVRGVCEPRGTIANQVYLYNTQCELIWNSQTEVHEFIAAVLRSQLEQDVLSTREKEEE